jgi:hypothetical protein
MATAAKRTGRVALDWAKVKAILSPQDFAVVNEQRARHMELTRILATPIPKIDLAQYKAVLQNQQVVGEVESSLQGFRPVKADPNPILKSLDEQQVQAVCLWNHSFASNLTNSHIPISLSLSGCE